MSPFLGGVVAACLSLLSGGCFLLVRELEAVDESGTGGAGSANLGGSSNRPAPGQVSPTGGQTHSDPASEHEPEEPPPFTGDGFENVLDDFEDGDAFLSPYYGRRGRWSVEASATGITSTLGVLKPHILDEPRGDGRYALYLKGGGYLGDFGAAFGSNLADIDLQKQPFPYDLSDYDGILVWARGSGQLAVQLRLLDTTPTAEGGVCEGGCFGHYSKVITLPQQWEPIVVTFTEMQQPDWANKVPLDPRRVLSIHFQNHPAPSSFEVWIDEILMYP